MQFSRQIGWVLVAASLIGCKGAGDSDSDVDNVTPVCDGRKQDGEDSVDAPFDVDGDGFFDASNPDCAATFQPSQLDCDDNNPDANPSKLEIPCNGFDDDCREASAENPDSDGDNVGACDDCDDQNPSKAPGLEEVCFDEFDNDCDGIADNDCGEDYNGTWTVEEPATLNCGLALPGFPISPIVTLDMREFFVIWQPPSMTIGQTTTATPPPFEGTVELDGTMNIMMREGVFGDCVRDWQLSGTFPDATHFEGTLNVDISGFVVCGNCPQMPQSWPISAIKQP